MNDGRVKVEMIEEPKRGPGGHWFSYVAYDPEYPDVCGYGQTALEARNSLKDKNK